MKRNLLIAIGFLAMVLVAGGVWLYNYVLGPTLNASAPIQAIPLETKTQAPTRAPVKNDPTPTVATLMEATATQADPVEPTATGAAQASLDPVDGMVIFAIVSNESKASFHIYEELAGQPKDVIGTTNQVAGEVALNPADLSQVNLGEIQVNARTLATDSERRNQAIRNRILNTDQYEFITFKPAQVTGLNGGGTAGQEYSFQVNGDLTIRDVTQPVTFEVALKAETDLRLTGVATATLKRADFKLNIPSVPNVANVGDEVKLEINFVLTPASQ